MQPRSSPDLVRVTNVAPACCQPRQHQWLVRFLFQLAFDGAARDGKQCLAGLRKRHLAALVKRE